MRNVFVLPALVLTTILSTNVFAAEKYVSECNATWSNDAGQTLNLTTGAHKYSFNSNVTSAIRLNLVNPKEYLGTQVDERDLDLVFNYIQIGDENPVLNFQLYRENVIFGSLNQVKLSGINYKNLKLNEPLKLNATEFITAKVEGNTYNRLDYECSLTRVE